MSWRLYLGQDTPVDGHTYNLTAMWALSGMIDGVTRELDGVTGRDIATRCEKAVHKVMYFRPAFETLNPDNGWGDVDGFLETLMRLWAAAIKNPQEKAVWSG